MNSFLLSNCNYRYLTVITDILHANYWKIPCRYQHLYREAFSPVITRIYRDLPVIYR